MPGRRRRCDQRSRRVATTAFAPCRPSARRAPRSTHCRIRPDVRARRGETAPRSSAPPAIAAATRAIVPGSIHGMSASATTHPAACGVAPARRRRGSRPCRRRRCRNGRSAHRRRRAPRPSASSPGRTTATTSGIARRDVGTDARRCTRRARGKSARSLSPPKRTPLPARAGCRRPPHAARASMAHVTRLAVSRRSLTRAAAGTCRRFTTTSTRARSSMPLWFVADMLNTPWQPTIVALLLDRVAQRDAERFGARLRLSSSRRGSRAAG